VSRTSIALALLALAACSGEPPAPVPVASAAPAAAGEVRPLSSRETAPPPGASSAPAGGAGSGAADTVDPAEPGISDLARLARYVFRTMRDRGDVCAFENPYRDGIHFALDVEVGAGRMTRVALGHVGVAGPGQDIRTLVAGQSPRELVSYVECLAPHLREVAMSPAPADGAYQPVYQYPGRPAGRAVP
jgi:hypothetical protein